MNVYLNDDFIANGQVARNERARLGADAGARQAARGGLRAATMMSLRIRHISWEQGTSESELTVRKLAV